MPGYERVCERTRDREREGERERERHREIERETDRESEREGGAERERADLFENFRVLLVGYAVVAGFGVRGKGAGFRL